MMNGVSKFQLKKWYLDCINQDGNAAIWYAAMLSFGRFALHYSNVMTISPDIPLQSRSTLRAFAEPQFAGSDLLWKPPFSDETVSWSRVHAPVSERLFETEEGSVVWNCLMPRAEVRGGNCNGTGYVETIEMTLPPWKLPIETLRWGRAHCGKHSIVWIQWQGRHPRNDVWTDGISDIDCVVDEQGIRWQDGRLLEFAPAATIRSGYLISTVLQEIPLLKEILPDKIASMHESKYLSRVRYCTEHETQEGWAIHEKVKF